MKMKTKIQLVTLIALIVGLSHLTYAQVTPPTSGGDGGGGGSISSGSDDISVIQSADLLRDLGLRESIQGGIYYSAPSIDWTYAGTTTSLGVVGKYGEDVFGKLAAFKYNFRLKNPGDAILAQAYGNDQYGNALFYGAVQFKVGEKPKISMYQWYAAVLGDVSSAEIIPLNEDGTSGQPIAVSVTAQGKILIQPWYSGSPNGLLAVRYNNGDLVTYRLSKPSGVKQDPSGGMATINIQGHFVFLGKDSPVIDIIAVDQKPTVLFECLKGYVTFDVRGVVRLPDDSTMIERPSGMTLTDEFGNNPRHVDFVLTNGPVNVPFYVAGRYRVREFDWNLFAQPGLLYAGPSDGGMGKGSLK